MPAVASSIPWALANGSASAAISAIPVTTTAPVTPLTSAAATSVTGGAASGLGAAAAVGAIAVIGAVGGFWIGDTLIRPLTPFEYPGGGGFGDYLRRNQTTVPPSALAPPVPSARDMQGSQGVLYNVTYAINLATRPAEWGGPCNECSTNEIPNVRGPIRGVEARQEGGVNRIYILHSDQSGNPVESHVGTNNAPPSWGMTATQAGVERVDGGRDPSPERDRNPGAAPGLINPPTLEPGLEPYPGIPASQPNQEPRVPPVPSAPPNSEPIPQQQPTGDPAPQTPERPAVPRWVPPALGGLAGIGVGASLIASIPAIRNITPPLINFNGRQPPVVPPTATPTGGCGCNAGITRAINRALGTNGANVAGQAASAGSIMARLNQMQAFAESAWKNTHLDKAINALTLLGVLHNAYYISTDVAFTFGEFVSLGLSAVGIRDEEGNALDINSLVKDKVQGIINSLIGEEQAQAISQRLSRFGRIFRAGTNIIWTLRNIQDTTADVLELTANNTGKIGNALKRSGVVDRLSYPWMPTNVQASDLWRRKFQRVFDGLEQAEDTLGAAYGVTANVLELGEEMNFLGQQKQQFIDEVTQGADVPGMENQPIREQADLANQESVSPELEGVRLDNANTITP